MLGADVADGNSLLAGVEHGEDSIVGGDEEMMLSDENDGAARRAYSGIDDDHVHGAGREVGIGLRDGQSAVEDVEGLDGVADVDDLGVGRNAEKDTFHRADEVVVESEVGG